MLRRRKVVQWGLVYGAAAWGFLQGLEYISGTYDWPRQLQQLTTLALLIGLPIILVLAWYHGDRGQQRITTPEFAILTLLLLLGGGAFWHYQRTSEVGKDAAASTASALQPDASPGIKDSRPSVAVLPFENRSDQSKDAYFVDGMHDDILTQLSKVSALRVISRTSVEQFRDTKMSMRTIADQLGVTKILEGGVQRAGDRVRINVQLIDAGTDAHLWAESYDRELTAANIFAIQSEVARAIAEALEATLTPAEKTRVAAVPTQSLEAWDAYQHGRQEQAARTGAGLASAERFFREAIRLDPAFALAHVGLADTVMLQISYSGADPEVALPKAEGAASEALRLNPELADAWVSSAGIAAERSDYKRAESRYLRAIELNPSYSLARHWYAVMLMERGRLEDGLRQIQRATDLDPMSAVIRGAHGNLLQALGHFKEAEAAYLKAGAVSTGSLARLYVYVLNRVADGVHLAQRARELDPDSPMPFMDLTWSYLDLSEDRKALELATEAVRRWPTSPYAQIQMACVRLLEGNISAATGHAQRIVGVYPRDPFALEILSNGDLDEGHFEPAIARYRAGYPELFVSDLPAVDRGNFQAAIDLAAIFLRQDATGRASLLLDGAAANIAKMPRLGNFGHGISDVQVHALRGEKAKALTVLREAQIAGWRGPVWRYYRDFDPNLASIRSAPEFKAVFADIERDMAQQHAALAARPKDAALELSATTH